MPPATGLPSLSELPASVQAALRVAFGEAPVEQLAPLSGGLSGSLVMSLSVGGAAYVLRQVDGARAAREIACLQIASDLGVAPRLRHADAAHGISIMDRVPGAQLGRGAPVDPAGIAALASTLRRLHDGPAFPSGPGPLETVGQLNERVVAAAGEGLPGELLGIVASATASLAVHWGTAPCHNDLNPNNILVAGDRVLLVDWDTACQGDPLLDLAQLGVFALPRPEQREVLLEGYLGRSPTGEERARATASRVVALAVYAAAFFMVRALSGAKGPLPAPLPLPELMATLGASRERTDPGLVAASLLLEAGRLEARD